MRRGGVALTGRRERIQPSMAARLIHKAIGLRNSVSKHRIRFSSRRGSMRESPSCVSETGNQFSALCPLISELAMPYHCFHELLRREFATRLSFGCSRLRLTKVVQSDFPLFASTLEEEATVRPPLHPSGWDRHSECLQQFASVLGFGPWIPQKVSTHRSMR